MWEWIDDAQARELRLGLGAAPDILSPNLGPENPEPPPSAGLTPAPMPEHLDRPYAPEAWGPSSITF